MSSASRARASVNLWVDGTVVVCTEQEVTVSCLLHVGKLTYHVYIYMCMHLHMCMYMYVFTLEASGHILMTM